MKGSYVLFLRNDRPRKIKVGRLGVPLFCKGFYAYIGSMFGPGGLDARISRHMCKTKAKHWHIDYILERMQAVAVYALTGKDFESKLSREAVKRYSYVAGFGCSDKRGDRSHLIYLKSKTEVGKFTRFIVSAGFKKYRPIFSHHV